MTGVDPLKVVVVDDDEDVRTALRRLLRSMGHDVHLFASAEEYEDCPSDADCMILDLRLPGLNGYELRERLRLRGSRRHAVAREAVQRQRPARRHHARGVQLRRTTMNRVGGPPTHALRASAPAHEHHSRQRH